MVVRVRVREVGGRRRLGGHLRERVVEAAEFGCRRRSEAPAARREAARHVLFLDVLDRASDGQRPNGHFAVDDGRRRRVRVDGRSLDGVVGVCWRGDRSRLARRRVIGGSEHGHEGRSGQLSVGREQGWRGRRRERRAARRRARRRADRAGHVDERRGVQVGEVDERVATHGVAGLATP